MHNLLPKLFYKLNIIYKKKGYCICTLGKGQKSLIKINPHIIYLQFNIKYMHLVVYYLIVIKYNLKSN